MKKVTGLPITKLTLGFVDLKLNQRIFKCRKQECISFTKNLKFILCLYL